MTSAALATTSIASFYQKVTELDVSSNPYTMTYLCVMDHKKITILLIFYTLSVGGCRGHPMRPKLNLNGKMSKPKEYIPLL